MIPVVPWRDLAPAVVTDLIFGQGVGRDFGLELLDSANAVVEDMSADTQPWRVSCQNSGTVHKALSVPLTRVLPWGAVRVKPYLLLSKGVTARFDLGVFVLTAPTTDPSRTPITYDVAGQDLMYLLDRQIGETYAAVVADGTLTYLTALRTLLADAGITGVVQLDGTAGATVIPATRVWVLPGNSTWLDVANDLLKEIAYTDMFNDDQGVFHSRPVTDDATRPPLCTLNTADQTTDLVGSSRPETLDLWAAPNSWRFVRNQLSYTPTVGDGVYEFTNASDGLSSVDSVGHRPAQVQFLDVADQAALIAEGNRVIAADQRATRNVSLQVDPLPTAGYQDMVTYIDNGVSAKLRVDSWEVTPYGKGAWVLGGYPPDPPDPMNVSSTATITSAAPLRVVCDGALVDSFANALDGTPYAVGDRVTVTVRSPLPPLINGVETS